jgi:predicted phage terminase large subunit-like protein
MVLHDPLFQSHARLLLQASMIDYAQFFFREMNHTKFIANGHHIEICNALQRVIDGEIVKLIINIGPRYGKTELVVKAFISRCLAINAAAKFIHLSYSDELALDNSEGIKTIVEHESYQALFPEVRIKKDSKAKKKWYTTAGGGVYATSTAGQVTGFGAGRVDPLEEGLDEEGLTEEERFDKELDEILIASGINKRFGGALIIDDPIKPDDAESDLRRERINNRYDTTIKNRVNSRSTPIIIIMQRLHEHDLCGYLLENEPGEWTVLSLPAIQEDAYGNEFALWPHKHTLEELWAMREQNTVAFERQYQQNPKPKGGLMYPFPFKTYDIIPFSQRRTKKAYIDTADEGTDNLCSICYDETELGMYVTDVIYTQDGMQTTEPLVAGQLNRQQTQFVKVESNNGGKGFSRNVEAQCRLGGNFLTRFEWFHQSANKQARIFTNAASVQNLIYFPSDWEKRWPKFAKHVTSYMAAGGNKHDDAEDVLTGMAEEFAKPTRRISGANNG